MTDTLPYCTRTNEHAISNAIRSGESPAEASTIAIPEFIYGILELCWRQTPADRFSMSLCHRALSLRGSLFEIFVNGPLYKVPSQYKAQNDGWNVIRNPVLQYEYEYEFMPHVIRNVRYVICCHDLQPSPSCTFTLIGCCTSV